MTVHGGKFMRINGIDTARLWTIVEQATQPKAVASNTLLGTARKRGVHSWNGTYQAFGAKPLVMPGSTFHFIGYGSPDNNVSGGTGLRYDGNAMCQRVVINWDWKTGAIIGHTVTFAGDLELDKATGSDPGDSVTPNLPETTGTKILWGANTTTPATELPAVVSAQLTISALTESYVNSSTYINGRAWTGQVSGPIDWSLQIQQEDTERLTGIFDIDDVIGLRIFTDSTLYWELAYGIVRDFSGITVNRETGAIIRRTINVDMNAYYGSNAGHVLYPDVSHTQWWPF